MEFQAVIKSCYCMGCSTFFSIFAILIDEAGDAILARLAIHAGDAVFAVGPFGAHRLDDGGHRTVGPVLAGESNLAVIAILAVSRDCLGCQVIRQFEGDFTVFCLGHDLIGCTAEGDGFTERIAAFSIVVALVFQIHRSRHFCGIHGQVIVKMVGIRACIGYLHTAVSGFHRGLPAVCQFLHIADIGAIIVASIGIFRTINTAAHIGDLVPCNGNGGLVDGNGILAAVPGFINGQAIIIYGGVPGLYAGKVLQFLGQADFQFAVGGFVRCFRRNDTDVAICSGRQFICISLAAQDIQLGVELTGHDIAAVAMEFQALCCHFLQLSHVNSVGIERACRHASKLASDRVVISDSNSISRRFPSRTMGISLRIGCLFSLNSQITVSCTRSHRTATQCNTVSQVSLCPITDSNSILCRFCYDAPTKSNRILTVCGCAVTDSY